MAKIEEDTREIGVMKAIGLRTKDIKNVYLLTYAIIALLGAMSGYFISLVLQAPLVENIRLYMGDGFGAALGPAFALLGAAVVFIGVVIYTYVVLNRLKRISVSRAVRYGYVDEKVANPSFYQLAKRSFVKVNAFLGVKDIVSRKKMYVTMFIILVLGVLALVLPLRLAMTLNDEQFVEYLGVGNSDVIFNVQQVDSVVMETNAVEKFLSTDRDVSLYTALTTKVFSAKTKNGEIASIKVELGDHRVFPINYVKGQAPTGQNEIALSVLSADDLRASVGDSIELHTNGNWRKLSVVGLYSDVTNGGKTAKANFVDSSASTMWSVVNVAFMDSGKVKEKAVEYTAKFPQVKVYDIEGYTRQMLGGIIDAVNSTVYLSAVVAVLLAFLITSMLMRMLTLKDRRSIAIMKALGFTARDIVRQYLYRSLFLLAVAIPLGLLLASTFGEWIVGVFMAQIGAVSVQLLPGWLPVILGIAVLVITVVMATRFGVRGSPKLSIADNIKE